MAKRERILWLLRYLQENSDEDHPQTTQQLLKAMEKAKHPATLNTLRGDMKALKDAGYEIGDYTPPGKATCYTWLDRELSTPELQILIDAVASSQFLTEKKSREIIRKLVQMAGPSDRASLQPGILISEHLKARSETQLLTVQEIRGAIRNDHRIAFRYMRYTGVEKTRVPRHRNTPEEYYLVSPYDTVWTDGRYYLLGYNHRAGEVRTFRIDRMDKVCEITKKTIPKLIRAGMKELTEQDIPREPKPADYRVQDYVDKVFRMYSGQERKVTLCCREPMLDQLIDRFGEDIELRKRRDGTFETTVPVCVSTTFFGWLAMYVGQITLIGPEDICEVYAEYMQRGADEMP